MSECERDNPVGLRVLGMGRLAYSIGYSALLCLARLPQRLVVVERNHANPRHGNISCATGGRARRISR